jgi:hypothetical protein
MKSYKKKIVIEIILLFFITMLFPAFEAQFVKGIVVPENNMSNNEFTHSVLGEYCTTTTCIYCPIASAQMYQVYNMGYNFSYVSLVENMNSYARGRLKELGFGAVPSVAFDGGYIKIVGHQSNYVSYQNAVITCGNRAVVDIDLDLDAFWMGGGQIQVNVDITNNEASTYNGHLHVYITEKISRWNDAEGAPYHFAMIGNYAINQNVNVGAGATEIYIKTWNSPYNDITMDNIKGIASVFVSSPEYTDETAAADPELPNNDPPSIPSQPTGPSSGSVGIGYIFSTSSTEPNGDLIQYGWDWDNDGTVDDWTGLFPSGQIVQTINSWDSVGKYNIKVKAKDQFGTESEWSDLLSVTIPKNRAIEYPIISWFFEQIIQRFPFFEKILNQYYN